VVVLIGFQTASGNKNEAMALAQDVGQLAMAVCSTVEELKEEIAADTELLDQVSTYSRSRATIPMLCSQISKLCM
jgi:hypothetical protein